MRKKFSIILAVILITSMQCGCQQNTTAEQIVQVDQSTKEKPKVNDEKIATAKDKEGTKVNKKEVNKVEEPFASKWVKATRFIQGIINTTTCATEKISKEEIDALFDKLVEDIEGGIEDESTVYYRLCNIIASMHHVHMWVEYPRGDQYPEGKGVCMDFIWTKEGIRVVAADPNYKEILGLELTKMNGYDMEEIMDKYSTIISAETEAGKKKFIYSMNTSSLKFLGIMKENDSNITMTFKDDKGEEREIIYDFDSEHSSDWEGVVKYKDMPFTFRTRIDGQNYAYVEKPEDGIMYFQYLLCYEQDGLPFGKLFNEMIDKMKEKDEVYDTLVIDARWNQGGNRYMLKNKLEEYKEYLNTKHIRVIIGDFTASAGVHLIEDCLEAFDDVILYGGPTCGAIHNYTEISRIPVPGTNMILVVPTCLDVMPELVKKYGDVTESVMPDVPVEISIVDLKKGIDSIYERIRTDKN